MLSPASGSFRPSGNRAAPPAAILHAPPADAARPADWPQLIAWLTTGPAKVLGRARKAVQIGEAADLTLIDPQAHWVVAPQRFRSKGRNTPFSGWKLAAAPVGTVRGRRMTWVWDSRVAPTGRPADIS